MRNYAAFDGWYLESEYSVYLQVYIHNTIVSANV